MSDTLVQIVTTVAAKAEAEKMAEKAVSEKLAACVQISGPVESHFIWKNQNCVEEEWVCTMKTMEYLADELMSFIQTIHSYETPEIIVIPILKVSPGYLKWAKDSVQTRKQGTKKGAQT